MVPLLAAARSDPLVCVVAALAVAATGGGDGFWLCVPLALLVSGPAPNWRGAAPGAALVTLAAIVPALASPGFGPQPSPLLVFAVVGGSVAVQVAVRRSLESERAAMRRWALTDPLTGVANRRGLGERIEYEVTRHSRLSHRFTVVMIDLDGFKLVNDRFGHPAGDELLRDVAAALREAVRDQDTVARLGGDEFCVLAPETGRDGGDAAGRQGARGRARSDHRLRQPERERRRGGLPGRRRHAPGGTGRGGLGGDRRKRGQGRGRPRRQAA